jgi:cyclohexyl-isocyanide hydratase
LEGYKAATHWATSAGLDALGVDSVHTRVVVNRNRITGVVLPPEDFGLTLLAELRGEAVAKMTQLMLEYDPHPPFDAGSPVTAGPDVTRAVMDILQNSSDSPEKMVATAKKLRRERGRTA